MTRQVLLLPIGCVADMESIPREPHEIWMALAGPTASAALALIGWCGWLLGDFAGGFLGSYVKEACQLCCLFNLVLACFNLLPCFPMDGGRVLRSLLALIIGLTFPHRAGDAFRIATRIAVRYVAWPLAIGVMVLTLLYTRLWGHLLLFPLLLLAGEAELWLFERSQTSGVKECELGLLPLSVSGGRGAIQPLNGGRQRWVITTCPRHSSG